MIIKDFFYNLIIVPVIIGNEQWGYIHISMLLEDFKTIRKVSNTNSTVRKRTCGKGYSL